MRPYIANNSLVIPFNCGAKYYWWAAGQSIGDTLKELGRSDLQRKYKAKSAGLIMGGSVPKDRTEKMERAIEPPGYDENNIPFIGSFENLEAWTKGRHIYLQKIHIFADGNGRAGRILYNWQRLKLSLPIHVIKYEDRWKYFKWFE